MQFYDDRRKNANEKNQSDTVNTGSHLQTVTVPQNTQNRSHKHNVQKLKQLHDITHRDHDHQHDKQCKSCGVHDVFKAPTHRRTLDAFDNQKYRPSAIKRGKRQSINNGKIDGKDRGKLNDI